MRNEVNIEGYEPVLNYLASVAFGTLAITLLFTFAYFEDNMFGMRACVAVAGLAFMACYIGTFPTNVAQAASAGFTMMAILVYAVAFLHAMF